MMKQTLIASAVASACLFIAGTALAEDAPAPAPSPLSFNVGVVSDYLFRGVSQTHGDPAISAGVDYAFSNGFYVGAWASTITWVKDAYGDGDYEIDFYGGYKSAIPNSDFTYDLGAIAYTYPGKGSAISGVNADPNTTEVYAALGYKWLTLKYSYAVSSHFIGWQGGPAFDQDTKGSNYLELNAAYDLGDGWGLSGHVGHQKVKDFSNAAYASADYTDWNIGVTKDIGFGVVGLMYSDTNTKGNCPGNSAYCWGDSGFSPTAGSTSGFDDVSEGTAVLTFKKTF
jgi:uncharacterized protein (TIGR02001 family)